MHWQARRHTANQYAGQDRRWACRLNRYLAIGVVLGASITTRADIINVPDDQPTILAGVSAAITGDEIVVAPGEYPLGELEFIAINSKDITLRSSGGADVTTIKGGGVFPVIHLGLNDSIIQGFTITDGRFFDFPTINGSGISIQGGSPTILDCIFNDNISDERNAGGAIGGGTNTTCTVIGCTFINNVSVGSGAIQMALSAAISNCTFQGNSSTLDDGGAVSLLEGTIENCTFTNNTAAARGGAVYSNGSLSLSGCTFTGNMASTNGGGVYMSGGTLTDCTFESNEATGGSGGGAWVEDGTFDDVLVNGCTFARNSAAHGAGLRMNGGEATGCAFDNNTATGNGGGLYVTGASPVVTQCTLHDNTAGGTGGGMYVGSGGTTTLSNTTLCRNTPDDLGANGVLLASGVVIAINGADCVEAVTTLGACCPPGGGCVSTSESSCLSAGGVYQGDGIMCNGLASKVPGDFDVDGDFDLADLAILLPDFTGPLP